MAVLGFQGTPSLNQDWGTFTGEQLAYLVTMPAGGGLITDIHVYARTGTNGGGGGAQAGYLCIWTSGGSLVASVACTIPNSESYFTASFGTPVYMPAGNFYLGVQIATSGGAAGVYAHYGNGSSTVLFGDNSSPPSALANFGPSTFTSSEAGIWCDYNPGGAWVYDGTQWNVGEAQVWSGSAWAPGALGVQVYSGSAWVTGN